MNQEKSRLADLSQYNNENNIDKLVATIEKDENESNEILIDNLIKAQDEVDFMAEETTKILNLQIEEKLRQIQAVEKQTSQLPNSKWFIITDSHTFLAHLNCLVYKKIKI